MSGSPKVAIVHYYLVNMRGGEKVVQLLCDLFPQADIFTLVCDPKAISTMIKQHNITTSFLQKLPFGVKKYQQYLPLYPFAIEQFDLSNYDLVLSSESGFAKGVVLSPDTCHICYCHSPSRYLWNMYHEYKKDINLINRIIWALISNYMRQWDFVSSQRVDYFIANSFNVKRRIERYYSRASEVVYPPLDFYKFYIKEPDDFYLFVGQLNPYKKADLAVRTFNRLNKKLIIIGDGPQRKLLKKIAGPNIKTLDKQPDDFLLEHYARCRALIFPGEEDFGITPLEAMASGKPVVAYARGGALETVVAGKTGVFFEEQSVDSLAEAVQRSEKIDWDMVSIRKHAAQFDKDVTREKLQTFIMQKYRLFREKVINHQCSDLPNV